MAALSEDDAPARRGLKFDPTINLGHVLSAGVFLITTVVSWMSMDARVAQNTIELRRVETQAREAGVRIETVLVDKINTERARMDQTQVRTADDIREIKTIMRDGFRELDTKLDRKTDKPGGSGR